VNALEEIVGIVVSVPATVGGLLLTWQLGYFLYSGVWLPYTGIDVLETVGELGGPQALVDWSARPEAWQGVHHILSLIPAAGFLLLLTGTMFIMFTASAVSADRR
jgi:hypothetical protein